MTVYYVVHKGRIPGIYNSWNDCKKQIDKFENAIFKKFTDKQEDEAKTFLQVGFGEGKKPRSVTRKENDDKKNKAKIDNETDDLDENGIIFIYTDGSCIKIKAGFGIYIPEKNIKVGAPLLNQKITNNRAEMTAIIESIKYLDESDLNKKICIFTDSQYCMYIFDKTGERYEKDGFKNNGKDVPNIDLIKKMLEIKRKYNIVLLKVRAHTDKKDKHSIGNDIADKLANEGADYGQSSSSSSNIFKTFGLLSNKSNNDDDSEIIDKNIQMNELFEFDESNGPSKISKTTKSTKLSKWFTKVYT